MNDIGDINLNEKTLKLYTAMQHLSNAIDLYFDGQLDSALVLAGAAEEMIGHFAVEFSDDNSNSFRVWNKALKNLAKLEFGDHRTPKQHKGRKRKSNLLKKAYNERKHLDDANQLYLEMETAEEIALILDRVTHDFILVDTFISNNFSGSEYYMKRRNLLAERLNDYAKNSFPPRIAA